MTQYVGIDWAYRRAAWCAKSPGGTIAAEGFIPADEDGLARLVLRLGTDVEACVEMMSGAVWVRDRLRAAGWQVEVADARRVKGIAPLACKTDRVDARVLAELCRRDLVPVLWIPSLQERELRERLRRRAHLVRLRTSAMNRVYGLGTQWGLRLSADRLRRKDGPELVACSGIPQVWQRSIEEALAIVELLDRRIAPLDKELRPIARADRDVALLVTIPGVGDLLALTLAAEIGDISRFPSPRKLVGYAGMAPGVKQSGDRTKDRPAALQGRLQDVALGRSRSRPARLPRVEPLAPAVHRPVQARRQQRRQVRCRTEDPHRNLAHALPPATVQAKPPPRRHQHCPGKLRKRSGRMTALI